MIIVLYTDYTETGRILIAESGEKHFQTTEHY